MDALPEDYEDHWNELEYARLPCSPQYCYRKKEDPSVRHSRWSLIVRSLGGEYSMSSGEDFEKLVNSYQAKRVEMGGLKRWLEREGEESGFFSRVLPFVCSLVLETPRLFPKGIAMLTPGHSGDVRLSQRQACCVVANSFMCTWPKLQGQLKSNVMGSPTYPSVDFSRWFSSRASESCFAKLRCVVHYFSEMSERQGAGSLITFERVCGVGHDRAWWEQNAHPLLGARRLELHERGLIEESGHINVHVDFANKLVGGGVLGEGCIQEEIMFVIKPELIASRLFVAELRDSEVIVATGAERFSHWSGYSRFFRWGGPHKHPRELDEKGRLLSCVLMMDALRFPASPSKRLMQLQEEQLLRELNKAFIAFSAADFQRTLKRRAGRPPPRVATGNWGCGNFNGYHDLKALLQLVAASAADKPLSYHTFGEEGLADSLRELQVLLCEKNATVGQVMSCLFRAAPEIVQKGETPQVFNTISMAFYGD